jgi:hypothetical protein
MLNETPMDEPIERFPDHVVVEFEELRAVIVALEHVRLEAEQANLADIEQVVEIAIGRMVRWFSPLLRDLDDEGE